MFFVKANFIWCIDIIKRFLKQKKEKLMSKKITEQDIIDSVASACQFISFYHQKTL